ncbi:MAG TPA: hypothetical protein VGM46_10960, partial [Mesorhizobium sp.]
KVVLAKIHSVGLVRDLAGAELVWVKNLGHKPDWIAADLVVAAIQKVAGQKVAGQKVSGNQPDLQSLAKTVEARIAKDAYGTGRCADIAEPDAEPDAELAPT